MTAPTFLIAGAARAGTTSLAEGLRTHPRVFVTQPKEPHYFALHGCPANFQGPGDADTVNRVAVTDRDDYLSLYPKAHDFLALGDGSVSTLYYAERAAPEIVRMNPDMRIVVILREPVDRAYSGFQYLKTRGFEMSTDFLAAVAEEPRRKDENWHHLWHYTSMSRYAGDLRVLQDALGRERVGVWFYDDLEADYQGTLRGIQAFLGLPEDSTQDLDVPRVNVSGTPKLAAVQRGIQAATGNEFVRRTVKSLTTYRFRERIRRGGLRSSTVTAEERAELAPRFADDLAELSPLVDHPLPAWLREPDGASRPGG
ncbi:MAG: sulfotransferase [Geodermatophilaceae bacterium]|nr:sulfotransferase [Geodermatophilaceae bacterium]MDQ3465752.1 sulfotransferase [Actinomycetota bacterium]